MLRLLSLACGLAAVPAAQASFELSNSEWMFNLMDFNHDGVLDEFDTRDVLDSNPALRETLDHLSPESGYRGLRHIDDNEYGA